MFLTSIYASPNGVFQKELWKQLNVVHEMVGANPWIVAGDFNSILNAGDK